MKKSELCVVIFMLGFCGFFYAQTLELPPAAQSYPKFVIGLLAVTTVLQLIKMVVSCHGRIAVANDLAEVWKGFLPKQFFVMAGGCVAFFIAMFLIGFYPAAILYLGGMLLFFHIPAKYTVLTLVVLMVLIYVVFSEFLNVPLPPGELLSEFL